MMRRLWLCLLLLLVLFSATLWHTARITALVDEMQGLLAASQEQADAERWEQALALTGQASALWSDHAAYLHVTLRHDSIDSVRLALSETAALLERQALREFAAANMRLIAWLDLLAEMEQLTLKNAF